MEAVNGVSDGGGPPPPSPLTGCYLLIVVGEPHSQEHKNIIMQRIAKGLLSWDLTDCLIDLERELAIITDQAPEGEEARYGERLIQYASENLVTEVLIHPAVSTLAQCVRNLLSSFTRHRHIIHAGYTFAANGSWILQDGTFSYTDFAEAFHEMEVQRVIRAYENSISVDVHCSSEGDWTKLPKESFAKNCKVRVNPVDVLNSGSPSINNFLNYISPFLIPTDVETLLECSDVVGNIRFSHPTLYIFPGGQGDAALFGINGFNMLLDGGFSRKACFWDFVRHLDRLDAVMLTRLNNGNASGISAVLRRKMHNALYPQIGHFFCNIQERKSILSPDGDKDKDPLLINLLDEGQELITNLKKLNLTPQVCYRDSEPINLYHKVGHGTLDMYVLSPAKDSREVKDFLQRWNTNDQKLFANQKNSRDFQFPLQNMVSICALLIWQPANPNDNITRILYPGSTPQQKIFEGLDRLKNLEYIKYPVCSENKLITSSSIMTLKSKQLKEASLEKLIQPDSRKFEKLKEKPPKVGEIKKIENKMADNLEKQEMTNGVSSENETEKTVKKSDSTDSEKSLKSSKKKDDKIEDKKAKSELKPKTKTKIDTKIDKKKMAEKKASPTTPKKTIEAKTNGEIKEKSIQKPIKYSPSTTPAKSAKEATNRKVIESKNKMAAKREAQKPPAEKKEPKPERKPISRRAKGPSPTTKSVSSPIKRITNGVAIQKPDIIKKAKLDKEATTDSSTVSTPSADQKDLTKLTPEEIEALKAEELADLKEEQEVVKEIEAVFRKGEMDKKHGDTELRKIKDISIDDKSEPEEYLIIEKEEVEHDSLEDKDTKEDEIQKLTRDSEESEKMRKLSDDKISLKDKEEIVKEDEEIPEEVPIETKDKDQKDKVDDTPKEFSATSPEDRVDESAEKKLTDLENQEQNVALESQPDERYSATIESGATTAPTLPEDERITLDEIKEDNGDQAIEEKHVKEDTKEKDVPVIQLPAKTFDTVPKIPPVVGIRLDKQAHIRDIVKTPDEVADLPVHEEADIDQYHMEKMNIKEKMEEDIVEEKDKDTTIKDLKDEESPEKAMEKSKEMVEIEEEILKEEAKIEVKGIEKEEIKEKELKEIEKPEENEQDVEEIEEKVAVVEEPIIKELVSVEKDKKVEEIKDLKEEALAEVKEAIEEVKIVEDLKIEKSGKKDERSEEIEETKKENEELVELKEKSQDINDLTQKIEALKEEIEETKKIDEKDDLKPKDPKEDVKLEEAAKEEKLDEAKIEEPPSIFLVEEEEKPKKIEKGEITIEEEMEEARKEEILKEEKLEETKKGITIQEEMEEARKEEILKEEILKETGKEEKLEEIIKEEKSKEAQREVLEDHKLKIKEETASDVKKEEKLDDQKKEEKIEVLKEEKIEPAKIDEKLKDITKEEQLVETKKDAKLEQITKEEQPDLKEDEVIEKDDSKLEKDLKKDEKVQEKESKELAADTKDEDILKEVKLDQPKEVEPVEVSIKDDKIEDIKAEDEEKSSEILKKDTKVEDVKLELEEAAEFTKKVDDIKIQEKQEEISVPKKDNKIEDIEAKDEEKSSEIIQKDEKTEDLKAVEEILETVTKDLKTEEIAKKDDKIEKVAKKDDAIEEVTEKMEDNREEDIEEVSTKDDKVEVAKQDEKIPEAAKRDEKMHDEKEEKLEEVLKKDEKIEESLKKDEKLQEVLKKDEKIEDVKKDEIIEEAVKKVEKMEQEKDEKIEDAVKKDEKIEEAVRKDDKPGDEKDEKITHVSKIDEKIEVAKKDEQIEEAVKTDVKVEEVAKKDEKIEVVPKTTDKIEEAAKKDEKIEITTKEEKIEEIVKTDSKIDETAKKDEKIEEVAKISDKIEEAVKKDEKMEVTTKEEKIEEIAETDAKIEEAAKKGEKIKEVAKTTDKIEEAAKKDDKIEVKTKVEKIEEIVKKDSKIEEAAKKDEKIEEVAKITDKIEEAVKKDEKIEVTTKEEKIEEIVKRDSKIEEAAKKDEKIEEIAKKDGEIEVVIKKHAKVDEIGKEDTKSKDGDALETEQKDDKKENAKPKEEEFVATKKDEKVDDSKSKDEKVLEPADKEDKIGDIKKEEKVLAILKKEEIIEDIEEEEEEEVLEIARKDDIKKEEEILVTPKKEDKTEDFKKEDEVLEITKKDDKTEDIPSKDEVILETAKKEGQIEDIKAEEVSHGAKIEEQVMVDGKDLKIETTQDNKLPQAREDEKLEKIGKEEKLEDVKKVEKEEDITNVEKPEDSKKKEKLEKIDAKDDPKETSPDTKVDTTKEASAKAEDKITGKTEIEKSEVEITKEFKEETVISKTEDKHPEKDEKKPIKDEKIEDIISKETRIEESSEEKSSIKGDVKDEKYKPPLKEDSLKSPDERSTEQKLEEHTQSTEEEEMTYDEREDFEKLEDDGHLPSTSSEEKPAEKSKDSIVEVPHEAKLEEKIEIVKDNEAKLLDEIEVQETKELDVTFYIGDQKLEKTKSDTKDDKPIETKEDKESKIEEKDVDDKQKLGEETKEELKDQEDQEQDSDLRKVEDTIGEKKADDLDVKKGEDKNDPIPSELAKEIPKEEIQIDKADSRTPSPSTTEETKIDKEQMITEKESQIPTTSDAIYDSNKYANGFDEKLDLKASPDKVEKMVEDEKGSKEIDEQKREKEEVEKSLEASPKEEALNGEFKDKIDIEKKYLGKEESVKDVVQDLPKDLPKDTKDKELAKDEPKVPISIQESQLEESIESIEALQSLRDSELLDKIELGRKSPKEREEDVAKIVASVAEVLKSDAPLEEFEGKIPLNITPFVPFTSSYTIELKETHITTVESPVTDLPKGIIDTKALPETIIEKEEEEDFDRKETKRSDLLRDSRELMEATSRMISDIKSSKGDDEPAKTEEPGTVHRMLVTASSEDGGEEIEICAKGSIIFSRSSESSGRSSPDQMTQKLKLKDEDKVASGKSTPDIKITSEQEKAEIEDTEKSSGRASPDLREQSPTPDSGITETAKQELSKSGKSTPDPKEKARLSEIDKKSNGDSGRSTPEAISSKMEALDEPIQKLAFDSGRSTPDSKSLDELKQGEKIEVDTSSPERKISLPDSKTDTSSEKSVSPDVKKDTSSEKSISPDAKKDLTSGETSDLTSVSDLRDTTTSGLQKDVTSTLDDKIPELEKSILSGITDTSGKSTPDITQSILSGKSTPDLKQDSEPIASRTSTPGLKDKLEKDDLDTTETKVKETSSSKGGKQLKETDSDKSESKTDGTISKEVDYDEDLKSDEIPPAYEDLEKSKSEFDEAVSSDKSPITKSEDQKSDSDTISDLKADKKESQMLKDEEDNIVSKEQGSKKSLIEEDVQKKDPKFDDIKVAEKPEVSKEIEVEIIKSDVQETTEQKISTIELQSDKICYSKDEKVSIQDKKAEETKKLDLKEDISPKSGLILAEATTTKDEVAKIEETKKPDEKIDSKDETEIKKEYITDNLSQIHGKKEKIEETKVQKVEAVEFKSETETIDSESSSKIQEAPKDEAITTIEEKQLEVDISGKITETKLEEPYLKDVVQVAKEDKIKEKSVEIPVDAKDQKDAKIEESDCKKAEDTKIVDAKSDKSSPEKELKEDMKDSKSSDDQKDFKFQDIEEIIKEEIAEISKETSKDDSPKDKILEIKDSVKLGTEETTKKIEDTKDSCKVEATKKEIVEEEISKEIKEFNNLESKDKVVIEDKSESKKHDAKEEILEKSKSQIQETITSKIEDVSTSINDIKDEIDQLVEKDLVTSVEITQKDLASCLDTKEEIDISKSVKLESDSKEIETKQPSSTTKELISQDKIDAVVFDTSKIESEILKGVEKSAKFEESNIVLDQGKTTGKLADSSKTSVIVDKTEDDCKKIDEIKTDSMINLETRLDKDLGIGKTDDLISSKEQLSIASSSKELIKPEESGLSGKSTPDIADVERDKQLQETLSYEKHIPGSSTPPTVPVSPIVKDMQDIKPEKLDTPIVPTKDLDIRSGTPGSDDYEHTTHSDISSSQMSRAPHLLEEEMRGSDDEDILGSPTSVTSQIAHSPSSQYDFDDEKRIPKTTDQMTSSFYGTLPGELEDSGFKSGRFLDDSDLDFEKAMQEHRQTRGEDLTAEQSYLYEITTAKFTGGVAVGSKDTTAKKTDIMTSSFMSTELPGRSSNDDKDKDPIGSWGKPLGLPSPAPPDNKGTPKKEKKLPANVTAKNKLNDDRKRSESPSKYDKKQRKSSGPIYVDLTYVPHHGNSNYSYVDFFKRIRARYYVFSGIEPSKEVYNALLEAKQTWEDKELEVTIIPTYDTDVLGYWVAENEELLTKYKIDLSPSASRCTINLQDHETSCSAYRLEF